MRLTSWLTSLYQRLDVSTKRGRVRRGNLPSTRYSSLIEQLEPKRLLTDIPAATETITTFGTLSGSQPGSSPADVTTIVQSPAATSGVQAGAFTGGTQTLTSQTGGGLTIVPTFASNITSDSNAATIESTINTVIAEYEAAFTDPITVNITFQEMSSGLGQSNFTLYSLPYSTVRSELVSNSTTSNDATALAHLPSTSTDPVLGHSNVWVNAANAKALNNSFNIGTPTGTVSLNTSICNLSRSQTASNKYDLATVTAHEIDEVLGLGSTLGSSFTDIRMEDLFRYNQNGTRSFTLNSSPSSYFSLDGTTDLAQFYQNQIYGAGDYGDWATGSTAQVQDAYQFYGDVADPRIEFVALDAMGYHPSLSPTITLPTSTGVTSSTATLGGDITSDRGGTITARGIVYSLTSTNSNPQIGGTGVTTVTDAISTTGVFAENVTGLTPGATYSFAAYSTNSFGTSYTSPVSTFTTSSAAAPTTTVVSESTSAASLGQSVTFTATVSAPAAPPNAGTVTFYDGATVLGTGTVNSNGKATFTTTALGLGSHVISATYGGTTNYAGSSSTASVTVTVTAPTTTVVTESAAATSLGQSETFTATITSGSGTPNAGTVTFYDGSTVLGTGTVSNGTATLTLTSLALGSHVVTATYSGSGNFAGSSSTSSVTDNVTAPTATVIAASAAATSLGQSETFTATITSGSGTPNAGTVTFYDGTTALGTGAVSNGTATLTLTTLALGTHVVTASYGGSGNFAASSSAASVSVTVTVPTTTVLTESSAATSLGQSETFTATITSGSGTPGAGTVTFYDGTAVLGTGTVSNGTATLALTTLELGTHVVTATYSGSGNFAGSSSNASVSDTVTATTTTILAASAAVTSIGQSETFTATISSGSGTPIDGIVTFFDGTSVLGTGTVSNGTATLSITTLSLGTHVVNASYGGGSGNFAGSTSTAGVTVTVTAPTTMIFSASAAAASLGQSETFTATVSSGSGTPNDGTVTFYDGTTVLGTGAVSSGIATYSTTTLALGTHVITASYAGSAVFAGSSASESISVTVTAPTTTTVTASAARTIVGQPETLTATVSSGSGTPNAGIVTFFDGSTTLGTGTVSNGTASLSTTSLALGAHVVTASYSGSGNFAGSASAASASVSVTPPPPTVLSLVPTSASPDTGTSAQFTVTFSASVTGVTANAFTLVETGIAGGSIAVSGTGAIYTLTVTGFVGTGTLGVNLTNFSSIVDAYNSPVSGGFTGGTLKTQQPIRLSGSSVIISGTSGDDVISVTEGTALTIVVNGVSYVLDPTTVNSLTELASTGNDSTTVVSLNSNTSFTSTSGSGTDSVTVNAAVTSSVKLIGGSGDDALVGGSGNNTLIGGTGNDTLIGGPGNDTIISGTENNLIIGGGGTDKLTLSVPTMFNAQDTVTDNNSTSILNLTSFTDGLTFSLAVGSGTPQVADPNNGFTLDVPNNVFSTVLLGGNAGFVASSSGGSSGTVLTSNIGRATGSTNVVTGNSSLGTKIVGGLGNNVLTGGSGNDFLIGGSGNSLLTDGNGNDTLYGGNGNSTLSAGNGNDTLVGGYADSSLTAGNGNDKLIGGSDNNTLIAGNGNDSFYSGTWNNVISSGTGVNKFNISVPSITNVLDTLTSLGSTNTLNLTAFTDGLTFSLSVDSGTPQVADAANSLQFDVQNNVFNVVDLGGNVGTANVVTGNSTLGTKIIGGSGDNTLAGGSGNDFLLGGIGNSLITDGNGNDTLYGGNGNSTLSAGNGNDKLVGGLGDSSITAGDGSDKLIAGSGNNTLVAGNGNDSFYGGLLNNVIGSGTRVNKFILSAPTFSNGKDTLTSTGSTNTLNLTAFTDGLTFSLAVGSGTAQVADPANNFQFDVQNNAFNIVDLGGNAGTTNVVTGNSTLGTKIVGGGGDNTLAGGSGNDFLISGVGNSLITDGNGNDTLYGGNGNSTLSAGNGNDTLVGGLGDSSLTAGNGNDKLIGGSGNSTLAAGNGNDLLFGGSQNNTFTVGNGNDTLYGGTWSNVISGGSGNNRFNLVVPTITNAKDTLTSTGSTNTLNLTAFTDGLTFSLAVGSGTAQVTDPANNFQIDVQNNIFNTVDLGGNGGTTNIVTGNSTLGTKIIGGNGNNTLAGGAGNDFLIGGIGNSLITDGNGNDTLYGGNGNSTLIAGNGTDKLVGGLGDSSMSAGNGNDKLIGGNGNNTLVAGNGNDSFYGGTLSNVISSGTGVNKFILSAPTVANAVDTLTGSGSTNTLNLTAFTDGLTFSLAVGSGTTQVADSTNNFQFNIQNNEFNIVDLGGITGTTNIVTGNSSLGTKIVGGNGNNTLAGGSGNDFLIGGIGNTLITDGNGNDTLYGGNGSSTLSAGNGNDTLVGGLGDSSMTAGNGNDKLIAGNGNNTLIAGNGNDSFYGGTSSNVISGGIGVNKFILSAPTFSNAKDTLTAAGSTNTLNLTAFTDGLTFSLAIGSGTPQVADPANNFQLDVQNNAFNIVDLGGNAGTTNSVTGNSTLGTKIVGGNGNNTLAGGSGNDFLIGGIGNSLITDGNGNDTLYGGNGNSTLSAGNGNDTLVGGLGDSSVSVGNGNDKLIGGNGNNTLIAGGGNDSFYGGTLNNVISGGTGVNKFILSAPTVTNAKDTLTDSGSKSTLNLTAFTDGLTFSLAIDSGTSQLADPSTGFQLDVQNNAFSTVLLGGNVGTTNFVTGNSTLGTKIYGGFGNNVLVGGAGNDTLIGGPGRDILIGGLGTDTLEAGTGGQDILIGGLVNFVTPLAALISIENEWASTDSYANRVTDISGPGNPGSNLNGSNYLTYLVTNPTVTLGTTRDTLLGGGSNDWFWANALDITNRQTNEILN